MRNFKRIIALLAGCVLCLALTSCNKQAPAVIPVDQQIKFPLETKITLTMHIAFDNTFMPEYETLGDHPIFKRLEEKTNIHIDFQHPTSATFIDSITEFNNIIASGDLPDIIRHGGYEYNGGPDRAVEDNMYLRLNDRIEHQMPNLNALMRDNAFIQKRIMTFKQNIVFLPSITGKNADINEPITQGLAIRKDMLDELQLDVPETIDDWDNVLNKLKTSGDVEMPLHMGLCEFGPLFYGEAFLNAYNTSASIYLNEAGNVDYGIHSDGMKEYLMLLNKWYSRDLLKTGEQLTKEMQSGDEVAAYCCTYDDLLHLKSTASNPSFNLVAAPYPVLKKGDKLETGIRQSTIGSFNLNSLCISATNQYPNETLKMLDLFYSDEMYMETSWGVESEDYQLVDGKPQFTKKITEYNINNTGARGGVGSYTWQASPYHDPTSVYTVGTALQKDAIEIWNRHDLTKRSYLTFVPFSEDEAAVNASTSCWGSGVGGMKEFVSGDRPFTAWDDYVDEVNAGGFDDQIMIHQIVYDRYLVA